MRQTQEWQLCSQEGAQRISGDSTREWKGFEKFERIPNSESKILVSFELTLPLS